MNNFIKLTECKGNVLILNTDRIEHITLGAKGNDTYIKLFEKENYFFVRESIDVIWDMVRNRSKAPIMMTAEEALIYEQERLTSNNLRGKIDD